MTSGSVNPGAIVAEAPGSFSEYVAHRVSGVLRTAPVEVSFGVENGLIAVVSRGGNGMGLYQLIVTTPSASSYSWLVRSGSGRVGGSNAEQSSAPFM